MNFRSYKYDKNINKYENYKKILSNINNFQNSKSYKLWQRMIESIFIINNDEINFYVKKIYFQSLIYKKKKNKFIPRYCNILKFFEFLIKYLIYFLVIKIKSKKINETKQCTVLIDEVENSQEIKLFHRFMELFKKEDVLILKKKNFKIIDSFQSTHFPRLKNYNSNQISFNKIIKFFFFNIFYSLKLRINLFYFFLKTVDDCFYYDLLAKKIKPNYIINFRIQTSNNIKNYFFNKNGAKICYIQKNISQVSQTTFNLKADILFCFGNYSYITNEKTFSSIKMNVTVGSFFMENNFYRNNIYQEYSKVKKVYDILYIGSNNFFPDGHWDTYPEYTQNYLEHLNWIKNLAKKFPTLKFIFKHHSNNKSNFERNYLKDTNIEFVDQSLNTYDLAYKSKFILSWGSTMIVELRSITGNSYFLDPFKKNIQFLNDLRKKEIISITNYEDLLNKISDLKRNKYKEQNTNFCLRSDVVNANIANFIKEQEKSPIF